MLTVAILCLHALGICLNGGFVLKGKVPYEDTSSRDELTRRIIYCLQGPTARSYSIKVFPPDLTTSGKLCGGTCHTKMQFGNGPHK